MNDPITMKVELGALLECAVWSIHKRGKNWWARIWKDPTAPGGLGREFAARGKGQYFYIIPEWAKVGVPVEFAGDYISGGGNRSRIRVYGVISEVTTDHLTINVYETAVKAINATIKAPPPKPDPYGLAQVPLEALEAEIKRRQEASWSGMPLGEPKDV